MIEVIEILPKAGRETAEETKQDFRIHLTLTFLSHVEKGTLGTLEHDAGTFLEILFNEYNQLHLLNRTYLKLTSFIKILPKDEGKRKERQKELVVDCLQTTICRSFDQWNRNEEKLTEGEKAIVKSCHSLGGENGYDLPRLLNEACRHFSLVKKYSRDGRIPDPLA